MIGHPKILSLLNSFGITFSPLKLFLVMISGKPSMSSSSPLHRSVKRYNLKKGQQLQGQRALSQRTPAKEISKLQSVPLIKTTMVSFNSV